MTVDNVLKLYSEVLRSEYLHYGFWDDPENIDLSTLSLQDIRNAQYRYIDHLASFIPSETKTILDVGCGIGGNTSFLLKKGYSLEDLFQMLILFLLDQKLRASALVLCIQYQH